jgi:hypothetical protein
MTGSRASGPLDQALKVRVERRYVASMHASPVTTRFVALGMAPVRSKSMREAGKHNSLPSGSYPKRMTHLKSKGRQKDGATPGPRRPHILSAAMRTSRGVVRKAITSGALATDTSAIPSWANASPEPIASADNDVVSAVSSATMRRTLDLLLFLPLTIRYGFCVREVQRPARRSPQSAGGGGQQLPLVHRRHTH